MATDRFIQSFGSKRRPIDTNARRRRFLPKVEPLDVRVLPAVTATFAADGTLRVVGDELANTIVVSRDAAGTIVVNNGAVAIQGGAATVANTTLIFVNGGARNDTLALNLGDTSLPAAMLGGDGDDVLTGGSGNDFFDAGAGRDTILAGAGDDEFSWSPGDGSDVVDGQGGHDALTFNGSDLAERFDISDSGAGSPFHRVRLTRDLGSVAMDLGSIEDIDLNANGGADTININDQTATDIFTVNVDLGGLGFGDGQADNVIINGTDRDDAVQIAAVGTNIIVGGLHPTVTITGAEAMNDRLTVKTLGGNDVVDAGSLPGNLIGLTVDLGGGQVAPHIVGVQINGGAAQRSLVTQIRVAFDQHVTLPVNAADAFRLARQSDGAAIVLRAAVDDTGSRTAVVLTFTGGAVDGASLADGVYTVTVLAGKVGGPNGSLDGNGDGVNGDDFVQAGDLATNKLFRLFGDVNGDAAVNGVDLVAFRSAFGTITMGVASPFDVNGDGLVNGLDLTAFRNRFGGVPP